MHKRWKEYLARLLQGDDQKMEQLRTRLDRLVRDGSTLVVEHIYTSVNDIDDRTKDIKSDTCKIGKIGVHIDNMKDTSRTMMDLLQKQHRTKHENENDLYDILRPVQPNTDKLEAILRDRISGTGNWLLAEPTFASWLRQEHPLLWICGSPGWGKTFLASSIISLVQSNISGKIGQWQSKSVGFFFLSKNDVHTRIGAFHQGLRDVAWQITRFDPKYTDHVSSQCRSYTDIETLPSAWRKLFASYFVYGGLPSLYLIMVWTNLKKTANTAVMSSLDS
jgi:hypothetical protein